MIRVTRPGTVGADAKRQKWYIDFVVPMIRANCSILADGREKSSWHLITVWSDVKSPTL